jgi:hypothetical protein
MATSDARPIGRWLVLPYDESAVARATLRRAARVAAARPMRRAGIMLAVAGSDPAALGPVVERARAAVAVPVEGRLLGAGDLLGALRRILADLPGATLAVPLGGRGMAPWCARTVAGALRERIGPCIAFYILAEELGEPGGRERGRSALRRLLAALRRAGAPAGLPHTGDHPAGRPGQPSPRGPA